MHFLHFYIHNIIQPYTMTASDFNLSNLKVFLNHIYELKKGIRKMALFTTHSRNREFAVQRLEAQGIDYVVQEVSGGRNVNIYFGAGECMEVLPAERDRKGRLYRDCSGDNPVTAMTEWSSLPACD